MTTPATKTPTDPSRSLTTSRYAPFMFRLSPDERRSSQMPIRFTTSPTAATAIMGRLDTSGGSRNRRYASNRMKNAIRNNTTAFARAARISIR